MDIPPSLCKAKLAWKVAKIIFYKNLMRKKNTVSTAVNINWRMAPQRDDAVYRSEKKYVTRRNRILKNK